MNYKKIFKTFFNKETIFIYVIGLVLFAAGVFCYEKARHAPRTFDKYFFQSATQGDGYSLVVADADKIATPTNMPVKKISRDDVTACVLRNKDNTYKLHYNIYREINNSSVSTYVLSTDFHNLDPLDISYAIENMNFNNSSKSLSITLKLNNSVNIQIPETTGWSNTGKRNQQVYRGVINLTSDEYSKSYITINFKRFPVGYSQFSVPNPIWYSATYLLPRSSLSNVDYLLYYKNNVASNSSYKSNLPMTYYNFKLDKNDPFYSTIPIYLNSNNDYYDSIWGRSSEGQSIRSTLNWTLISGDKSISNRSQDNTNSGLTQTSDFKQKSIIENQYNGGVDFSGFEAIFYTKDTTNC